MHLYPEDRTESGFIAPRKVDGQLCLSNAPEPIEDEYTLLQLLSMGPWQEATLELGRVGWSGHKIAGSGDALEAEHFLEGRSG